MTRLNENCVALKSEAMASIIFKFVGVNECKIRLVNLKFQSHEAVTSAQFLNRVVWRVALEISRFQFQVIKNFATILAVAKLFGVLGLGSSAGFWAAARNDQASQTNRS